MDRTVAGYMSIGGRRSNRSFHGKVASMVITTLRRGAQMPSVNEIGEMITDPIKWVQDYKVGNPYRYSNSSSEASSFSIGDNYSGYGTQVFLMGDGANDSYSNMIRNYVNTTDQNYTKLNMISMVSNDIENVTVTGIN